MNKITISLIVPIYGVETYIAEFAHSALGQSYPHIQYVFVNDGTKDNSMQILEKIINECYSHRKGQIVIVNKLNGGLPAARHTGVQHATGDYIFHADPDDWLSENAIALIADKIEETGSDVIYFNYVKEYESRSSVKKEREYDISQKDLYIRNMYNHRAFGTLCNKCIKRSLYETNGIHHPLYPYAEDCFLSVQLAGYARSMAYLDMEVYHYRKNNPHSITRQGRKRRKEEYAMNFLNLYELYKDKGITKIVGIESRGFVMASSLAVKLGAGFVPIRKPGKLPAETISETYGKEYGRDTIEIHKDAIDENDVVLIHDDLLATGGTMLAAYHLVKKLNPKKVMINFIIELEGLKGRETFPAEAEIECLLTLEGK